MASSEKHKLQNLSFIQFVNTFSLMVVLGAVSTSFFFVRYFNAEVPISFYWVLASGVWIIYTADHLRDGYRLKNTAYFLRHQVHYQYRQVLIPTVTAITFFDLFLVFSFFPFEMIQTGLIMSSLVVVYFFFVHVIASKKIGWLKEIIIAIMVCAGMVVYPGLKGDFNFGSGDLIIALVFTMLNYCNLLIFAYFDYEGDSKNNMPSTALYLGRERTKQYIYHLLAIVFVLLTIYAFFIPNALKISATVSILAMLNILVLIFMFDEKFSKNGLYRFWGDFIYLIPSLIWLFLKSDNLF